LSIKHRETTRLVELCYRIGMGESAGAALQMWDDQPDKSVRLYGMDSSTTDKIKGNFHEAKGKVKEETGRATGNRDMEDRGTGEKVGGKVERKVGDVKKVFGK
jgi:uncharacterized protein YjbJ (UPF0337 family)